MSVALGEQLRPAGAVEQVSLRGGLQQPMLVRLPVDDDEGAGHLGEQARRHRRSPGRGTRPALDRDVPADDQLVVVEQPPGVRDPPGHLLVRSVARKRQPSLDAGAWRAGTDERGIGSGAKQQPEGRHEHGLARAGLAGEHVQPRAERDRRVLDHAE